MAANPITDQLAAGVAAKRADYPELHVISDGMARAVAEKLPNLTRQAIGEVMLHVASCLGGLMVQVAEQHGGELDQYPVNLLNVLAQAGQQLYTEPEATAAS